jgi:hypothetical protein
VPSKGRKGIIDDVLQPHHWDELEHLHNHLEPFYEATLMVEGSHTTLADHFITHDWLMGKIDHARQIFSDLYQQKKRKEYLWLSSCAEVAWEKCEAYFNMADDTGAYYAAIMLDPTL